MSIKQSSFRNPNDAVSDFDNVVENATSPKRDVSFNAAQAYADGHLSLEILSREIGVCGGDGHQYLTVLHKRKPWGHHIKRFAKPLFWGDNGACCSGPHRDDQIVRVPVPESMQQNESVAVEPQIVSSFVWFQTLDKSDRSRAILPEFVERICFELGSMSAVREFDFLKRIGLNTGRAGDKQIQGGTDIENDVAHNCAPAERDRLMRIQDQMANAIRVYMDAKRIWLVRDKSRNLDIEICEVFLCPFYLGARSEPWISISGGDILQSERGIRIL